MIAWTTVGARAISTLLLVAWSTTARAQCKPTAVADGDPALVQGLVARLAASGIATTPENGCPVVQVKLEMRGQQLHLGVRDAFDRRGERDVQDVATAAAIIESWTTQEIEEGALPPVMPAPEVPHVATTGLAVGAMSAVGTNGTTWLGGAVSACARLGPLCGGVHLRAEKDTNATGDSSAVSQDSYQLTALATIDLPRRLAGFVISPGLGAGYGWLHVVTHHHDAMNNPLDVPTSDHQLRAAAHVAVQRGWLFADLWTDVAALRSDSQFGPTATLRLALGVRLEVP